MNGIPRRSKYDAKSLSIFSCTKMLCLAWLVLLSSNNCPNVTALSSEQQNDLESPPHHERTKPTVNKMGQVAYGVDISWPMHSPLVSNNYPHLEHNRDGSGKTPIPDEYKDMPLQIMGNKRKLYEDYMQGCRDKFDKGKRNRSCDSYEEDRVQMSLRQPQSMQNYTELGFKKIKAPETVFRLVKEFWDTNKHKIETENWGRANSYANHWSSPTGFLSVEDSKLRGGGNKLKDRIWNAAKDTLEEWTGQELTPCSLYGIRIYHEGAILATHVDRLPLVSSAILNVAQDVDEPWPIEVIGHDGMAYNITQEPGDMVLYESHSLLHGRPFPLVGRSYANVFIHFEPVGHSLRHGQGTDTNSTTSIDNQYKQASQKKVGGHETHAHEEGLPTYILPFTPEADHWKQQHPEGWHVASSVKDSTGSTLAHTAAQTGDVETLKDIAKNDPATLHKKDKLGWHPIHEASRGGHYDAVKLLIEHGSNVNEPANDKTTPLFWAQEEESHQNYKVIELLKSLGGISVGPEF
mmetsp:Transcript_14180/g.20251  ORF Transcript_14180/g.20251 Transcript_14180/m.20251 type:complete len:520 (+) Transcript_14180:159-1718(+)|eukprot:CAMPEP_0184870444 /NCGR_PEP_ID=MMETSP0580-20130426/37478_1 /TAXON_ID=1118495 /ORGANISM="Dactyliosolen fragilissimus" /LENGTH=519 /DNA_ID=CAMNT_0027372505 /DNA_START=136 /DNA_END=1695 /DNA_ORIENTATION=+